MDDITEAIRNLSERIGTYVDELATLGVLSTAKSNISFYQYARSQGTKLFIDATGRGNIGGTWMNSIVEVLVKSKS